MASVARIMPPKRVIKVESKISTAGNISKRTLPSTVGVGQPCTKCEVKCVGGYVPHLWRKQCVTCGCTRDYHSTLKEYEGLSYLESMLSNHHSSPSDTAKTLDIKYAWYPSGVDHDIVEKYMQCLPKNCIPYRGSNAEQQRKEHFLHQHPSHDASVELCHDMPDIEKKRHVKFGDRRIRNNFGVGRVSVVSGNTDKCDCYGCSETISPNSIIVTAEKTDRKMWHPWCFRCNTCMDLLVDLLYFYSPDKDAIYCGRHHGETLIPRCQDCDELIFAGTYTETKGKCWHKRHFSCNVCELELHGKVYRVEDEKVYCEKCYDKYAAVKCQKCKNSIGIGSKKVRAGSNSWHKECFVCKRCKQNIHGTKYYFDDDLDLLCHDCQGSQSIAQCQGCKLAISSTVSFLKHKKLCWHAECFKCTICQSFLADGSFKEMESKIICDKCYTIKFSKKCSVCQESITAQGVQFGLSNYHKNCFKCSDCSKNLIGESKIKDNGGQPLCYDCSLKDAKKCFRCRGPITSRHTLYKGQPFHLECFKCNLCGSSIGGTDFYETSLNEILCARCASIN